MSQQRLEELRKSIDKIDEKLLELLNERIVKVESIFKAKQDAGIDESFDSQREISLLRHLKSMAGSKILPEEIESIFLQIISVCRKKQKNTRVCVFGEKFGWVNDAALARFGSSTYISTVDNLEDFLTEIDNDALGFACFTPEFSINRNALLESMLTTKFSIIEEFTLIPEFSVVGNKTKDLSEIKELYVTKEILNLLRNFFLNTSFDFKIKICQSMSEVYENLQNSAPVAAILPSNILQKNSELLVITKCIKSEMVGPLKFMIVSKHPNKHFNTGMKTTILCAMDNSCNNLCDVLSSIKKYDLDIFDIQSTDFDGKPWHKIASIEFSMPSDIDKLKSLTEELENNCMLVKICGIYPRFY